MRDVNSWVLIALIVPVVLIGSASVGLADGQSGQDPELNDDLNTDLNHGAEIRGTRSRSSNDRSVLRNDENLNESGTLSERSSRKVGERRGRQARRGQTAITVASNQGLGSARQNDSSASSESARSGHSRDSGSDEDEDEGPDTPVSN